VYVNNIYNVVKSICVKLEVGYTNAG